MNDDERVGGRQAGTGCMMRRSDLEMIIVHMKIILNEKLLVKRTLTGDDLIERLFVIYDFCPVINIPAQAPSSSKTFFESWVEVQSSCTESS